MTTKPKRILAIASGGGHWVQLLRLRPAFVGAQVTYVTVDASYRDDVGSAAFRVVNDATRWNKFGLIRVALRLAWIMMRVRPDTVITTGAAPGYLAIILGKFLGAKTMWIDSIANVDCLSSSGQRAGRFADLWLTQWQHLAAGSDAERGGPRFMGAVI